MPETGGKPSRTAAAKRKRSGAPETRYAPVDSAREAEAPKKKNLRLHQSKIDEAKEILGTATETETIEAALDLVIFRKELTEGVRAMRGTNLVGLFDAAEG
jgi:hypothetical protein